jgi:hypothetical protein
MKVVNLFPSTLLKAIEGEGVNAEFQVSHDSDHSCHIYFFITTEYKLGKPHTTCK